ncbi:MAG: glycerol-3-phosphate acyltransferase [Fimbriiglobus sp.]
MIELFLGFVAAYLCGSVPFGYCIGRMKGVNLLEVGSKNIGATNAGRTLGRPYGVLIFVLDFLKGAVPTAAIVPLLEALKPGVSETLGSANWLRVGAAAATLVGHMLPVFLKFRGGKGVATGAGIVAVLTPVPMLIALGVWGIAVLGTRFVSVASIAAALTLGLAQSLLKPGAFGFDTNIITGLIFIGVSMVIFKHRANMSRLIHGTENSMKMGAWQERTRITLHVVSLGLACGSGFFFNFLSAPAIFESFKTVVKEAPSDRTAMQPIGTPGGDQAALASALAGSAVGPIFPRHFALQAACAVIAFFTARGRWHWALAGCLLALAIAGWPVSQLVTELRIERFSLNPEIALAAKAAFGPVHLVSLAMSALSSLLSGFLFVSAVYHGSAAHPTSS